MDVSIQVGGAFHAFRLAEQLDRHDSLNHVTTTYPYFIFERYRPEKIPQDRFKSIPLMIVGELINRTPFSDFIEPDWTFNQIYDIIASHRIGHPDILVGWPGASLRGIRRANSKGITTVVDADAINITSAIKSDPDFAQLQIPENPDNYVFQKREIDKEYDRYDYGSVSVEDRYIRKTLREFLEADNIMVPTQYVYDAMTAIGLDESKLTKVPFGVDTDLFHPVNREPDHSTDAFQVVFVGQIRLRKGVQYLLEAVADLDNDDIELTLVGSVHENMEEILEEHEEAFTHVEHLPQERLVEYYSLADAFVFPSILEGFGMVVNEAMACGAPVVTTTHTGGVELVEDGENGFLVEPRDIEAIQEAIMYLYENPDERERISTAAVQTAQERSWDDYGDDVVSAYQNMINL
jgi:glycosyltransferase involved in cell wall biosynthesis